MVTVVVGGFCEYPGQWVDIQAEEGLNYDVYALKAAYVLLNITDPLNASGDLINEAVDMVDGGYEIPCIINDTGKIIGGACHI